MNHPYNAPMNTNGRATCVICECNISVQQSVKLFAEINGNVTAKYTKRAIINVHHVRAIFPTLRFQ